MACIPFNTMGQELYKDLPDTPGVYLMKDSGGRIIYVGKAANLKRRVSSYFTRPHDSRIAKLVSEIVKIDHIERETAIEALILEADLIKKYQPIYNIKEKDDRSFLYIEITKDKFPRVLLVRGKSAEQGERFGPFTSASSAREALRILRKIFPWSVHPPEKAGKYEKPCFDYEVGSCPGVCIGAITKADYMKNIRSLKMFLKGQKKALIKKLGREMKKYSDALDFEYANVLKRRIFALNHIQDVALISEERPAAEGKTGGRIEGYDISNISGRSAVGSMVVFIGGEPDKKEYKKFKIHSLDTPNDTAMMKEIMERRIANPWPIPDVILVDGGKAQVNVVKEVLSVNGIRVPVIGMVKGPDRKRTDLVGDFVPGIDKKVLERVRDEAHRFAIGYHKRLRSAEAFN
ncbi:MAG: GIY-YIG nuclease family protein [Candidatus Colwellbacteria bacterium]|nr:GIY-YIG nuclease family protein [Candidatus Colwellbacteria bacterium]